jgi:hypothetical protein
MTPAKNVLRDKRHVRCDVIEVAQGDDIDPMFVQQSESDFTFY